MVASLQFVQMLDHVYVVVDSREPHDLVALRELLRRLAKAPTARGFSIPGTAAGRVVAERGTQATTTNTARGGEAHEAGQSGHQHPRAA